MPSKAQMAKERRQYQAEDIIREAYKKSPDYKREMKRVMAELKAMEDSVTLKKK